MHLLAVDDDPIILELLEEFVNFIDGHTMETASSAVDALDLLARPDGEVFDCFLLDIQMPGTDGIELCKIIRGRPDHRSTPILMLTAMSDKAYIDKAFAAGASDYITKPFEVEELRGRIGLVDSLIAQRKADRGPDLPHENQADPDTNGATTGVKPPLHEPMAVHNVDGVIEHQALENYVSLLSRKQLFGSTVFAFCIRGIQDLYEKTSCFEYECIVTDVSDAISASLENNQFLISYAGNGVFVCIVEQGWQPDPSSLTDSVNLTLHKMGLFYNDGKPMNVSVSVSEMVRLVWKSGDKAVDALATVYESAERESKLYARNLEDFWYDRHSA
ncbi:response regulator [Roseovarius sp. 2305UL8-3]|uniref:response regulator n=1 Tax=Roseovarius conchicola TaxID=3121636 RepID=UPI00352866A1